MRDIMHEKSEDQTDQKAQARIQCAFVAAIMSTLSPSFRVEFDPNGSDRTVYIGGNSYRVARDTLSLSAGTVFQTPSCVGIPPRTVEYEIQSAVNAVLVRNYHLADVNARNMASTITRILVDGVWHKQGEIDHFEALARSARTLSALSRADIARMGSKAFTAGGADGVKRLAQALNAAPIIHRIVDEDRLVADVVAGRSPVEMAKEAGGSAILTKLSKNSLNLIDRDNVEAVVKALAAVRSRDLIPTGRGQRDWLSKLLPLAAHDEPAAGFQDWLADRTAWHQVQGDFAAAMPAYFALSDWAEATAGQGGGWSNQKSLAASFTAATEWSERERKRAVAEAETMDVFPVHFRQYEEDSLIIRQITTAPQMIEVGDQLHNCLATMTGTFAKHALTGARVYAVVHNVKTANSKIEMGAPRSAAEIVLHKTKGPMLKQHYARRNSSPAKRDRDVIEGLIQKIAGGKVH